MKILILIKKWEGGIGSYLKNISKEFDKKNISYKIISRENDLKIYSFRKSIIPLRRLVKKAMRKEKFDIIYTHDWSLAFPLLYPTSLFRKKHFCCFHGYTPEKTGRKFQQKVGRKLGNHLFVVNPSFKNYFPKSIVNLEAVDMNLFKPLRKKRKGIGFSNWKDEIYNYKLIKKVSGQEFFVAENLSLSQMNNFYNKIEKFVSLPPYYTGFGLAWLEAMAAGVKYVIGNNAGVGKFLPITKVEDFGWKPSLSLMEKEKILKLALKKAKKQNYREWIENNKNDFNWDKHIEKLIKIWKIKNEI